MMTTGNLQLKITLLNVPNDVSALKLRGYVRNEIQDIQNKASKTSFVIVRVFLSRRTVFAFGEKKLDMFLGSMVEKYSHIHRVELVVVESSLDIVQLQNESALAQKDMADMIEDLKQIDGAKKDPANTTIH